MSSTTYVAVDSGCTSSLHVIVVHQLQTFQQLNDTCYKNTWFFFPDLPQTWQWLSRNCWCFGEDMLMILYWSIYIYFFFLLTFYSCPTCKVYRLFSCIYICTPQCLSTCRDWRYKNWRCQSENINTSSMKQQFYLPHQL